MSEVPPYPPFSIMRAKLSGALRPQISPKRPLIIHFCTEQFLVKTTNIERLMSDGYRGDRERILHWQPTGPNPLNNRDGLSGPALRHGSLKSFFRGDRRSGPPPRGLLCFERSAVWGIPRTMHGRHLSVQRFVLTAKLPDLYQAHRLTTLENSSKPKYLRHSAPPEELISY